MSNLLTSPDISFDPYKISYSPWVGAPGRVHTETQLRAGGMVLRYERLERVPGGYMAVTERRNGLISKVSCWDEAGRLARVDFIGTVGVHDRSGEFAGQM